MPAAYPLAPGPRPHPLLGHLTPFRRDPLGFLSAAVHDYGDIVGLRVGRRPAVFLRHPDHIQIVLQANRNNYVKQAMFKPIFGEGIATASGSAWRRQRRLLTPWFHPRRVAAGVGALHDVLADLISRWRAFAAAAQSVDVLTEMRRLAVLFVGRTLFSARLDTAADDIRAAADLLHSEFLARFLRPVRLPLWLPTPANHRFRAALHVLDALAYGIIANRPAVRVPDLLGALLQPDRNGSFQEAARDQILTLLLAAYENTGNALTWLMFLVARYPEVQQRVHGELLSATHGALPTGHALAGLPYTRMVIDETLRLYPTGWIIRVARSEDAIGGYRVPANSVIVVSPYLTHRHPEFWTDPEAFNPERFAGGHQSSHPFSYLPFGEGPRQCLGGDYAVMEMLLTLAAVVSHFHLQLVPGQTTEIDPLFSLAPRRGLAISLAARGESSLIP